MSSLGNRLRQARLGKNLTQDDAAKKIGVTRSIIARYESSTNDPSSENIKKLAELYEVSADWLLELPKFKNKYYLLEPNEKTETETNNYKKYIQQTSPETPLHIKKLIKAAETLTPEQAKHITQLIKSLKG